MAQWASEISLSGPVSLFESFSLVNDNNFQTNYFKTEHCQMSDTIILVESINQFKIQVHICPLMLLVWSPYWSNPVVALCYNPPLFIGITWELQQVIGSFSIDNSNGSENITSKWICLFSNLVVFIPMRWKCQMLVNFPGVELLGTPLKFRTRKKKLFIVTCLRPP